MISPSIVSSKIYKVYHVYDLRATKFIQELTTTEDVKDRDEDVLTFFYIDHKFFKSKKLMEFIEERKKNNKIAYCLFKNCDYSNEDVELLICHLFACLQKPRKNFTCKFCFAILNTTSEAESHIHEQHEEQLKPKRDSSELSSSSAEEDDGDSERRRKKKIRRENREDVELTPWELLRIQDLQLYNIDGKGHLTITKHLTSNFPTAYKWNLEFVKQNFSSNLYCLENSFSDWNSVLPSSIVRYLPKLRTSFDTTFVKTNLYTKSNHKQSSDYEWISLKLYEVQRANDSWTLFCGGPVNSLAWAPIYCADDKELINYDQYLAVSVLSDPDLVVKQGQVKTNCGLIQIWNFGPLQVEKSMFEPDGFKPYLEYCLAHEHGDYLCMEWCPSGGFDKNHQLGLLAIGGTDSFVHIYAMPLGTTLKITQGTIIFEAKPKYKLECMNLKEMAYTKKYAIPTCISWTKAKDHRYIAVGYCCGLIAIFDILTESPHLKSIRDNIIVLKPYLVYVGHTATITAISLHHIHGGNRWLASFSMDKTHKLWDLENHSQPIYVFTKVHMVDGIWPTHWLTTIMSNEDIVLKEQGASTGMFVPIKRFTGTYFYFYNYFTRTNSLAVSDWSNMIAYCNVVGHVMGGFVNTCIPTASHGMPGVHHYNISITNVIEKKGDLTCDNDKFNGNLNEISYIPAKKRYGIIFCDSPISSYKQLENMRKNGGHSNCKISKMNANHSPDMYPLRSATKIAINPNQQAHSYMAVGYQLGFVRIFCPYLNKGKK